MVEIEFLYDGQPVIILCNLEDKMQDITKKYTSKIKKNINELFFLYKGNHLNMNLKLNQIITNNSEKIKILVYNNSFEERLILKFDLKDQNNNNNIYNIILDLSFNFDIIAEYNNSFPKKIYKNTFTLEELKNRNNFFKIYNNIRDSYEDIKSLLDQNKFTIQTKDNSVILSIKKQFGIAYDIDFPLKEENIDINSTIYELCNKYNYLEKNNNELIIKNENLEKSNNELKIKCNNLEKSNNELILKNKNLEKNYQKLNDKIIELEEKLNKLINLNNNKDIKRDNKEVIKHNDFISISQIQFLFDNNIKNIELIHSGINNEKFFENCKGKNNLLFLIKDDEGNQFGGFMSSQLYKNLKNKELIIKDKNAFIFNLQNKKKFKVIKENNAININDCYLICFGGTFSSGNDFFIEGKNGGMNNVDAYGDIKYETTNGKRNFFISDLKVYQIYF